MDLSYTLASSEADVQIRTCCGLSEAVVEVMSPTKIYLSVFVFRLLQHTHRHSTWKRLQACRLQPGTLCREAHSLALSLRRSIREFLVKRGASTEFGTISSADISQFC